MFDYWYDDSYDYYSMDLGLDGLFGDLGSLFGDLFSYGLYDDDYDYYGYDDYDYEYDEEDDDVSLSVDSYDSLGGLDDLSVLGSIFGLLDDSSSLSVDGLSDLLDGLLGELGLGSLFGDLLNDDYYGYSY